MLATLFEVPAVAMLVTGDKVACSEISGDIALTEAGLDAAQSSAATGTHQLADVYSEQESHLEFWPVETASGERGDPPGIRARPPRNAGNRHRRRSAYPGVGA